MPDPNFAHPDLDPRPLHERDPTGRFSARADDYVRYRPTYPAAAIDAVLSGLGDPHTLTAADVGAGTGIASRLLADRGVHVRAVEPNAAMLAAALPHPLVDWCQAPAEATGLATGCVSLVLCAQSFHWFRHDRALREFHRVLAPGGRLALIWNDDDHDSPATNAYRAAVSRAAARDWTGKNPFSPAGLIGSGLFTNLRILHLPNAQRLDLPGLIGRARSASYVPRDGPRHDQLILDLAALHEAQADTSGLITLGYRTDVYLADAVIRSSPATPD